jgi:hypothetical protein
MTLRARATLVAQNLNEATEVIRHFNEGNRSGQHGAVRHRYSMISTRGAKRIVDCSSELALIDET